MHSIQETSEYQRPRVVGSEPKNISSTMRKISPNCMLKSTILIKDAKKILTKDLKVNAGDNISDISGINELPDSEPSSLTSHVDSKDMLIESKTEKCIEDFQRRANDSNLTKSVIQRTQSLHCQTIGAQNTVGLPKLTESLKSNKPSTKSLRDMKLRPNKSYRIIEMPKKDFEEFMAHRRNKNTGGNSGKCPNRISFDFINKNELRNQTSVLNSSMRNNSKSTGCLRDIEKLENPGEALLKTSKSSETISPETKSEVPCNKTHVVVKPTIVKPARSFKPRPLVSNNTNQNVNTSNALKDMILKPPDRFSKTLTPSNSFNKDIQIIRELDNSLHKTPILAKIEPLKTESMLERNPMNYTAVLKNSVKPTTPKPSVTPMKDDLTSPRLVASKMRILNSNPGSISNAHKLRLLTPNDSKLLAASRTLDDIRKDLDNMRNRPSHKPSHFNKDNAPHIKAEIPKRIEPIKIVTNENKDLDVSLDSNKYLKLIPTPPKKNPSTEHEQTSEDTNEESNETDNETNEMNKSTLSLPSNNQFKSATFSTIESNRTDHLESSNFVIGSSSGAFKSLSTLSLERKSNQEDVYLNRSHIKPITKLKSSQSFQHRSTLSDDVRETPAVVKKPTRHSSLNNSFRSLRALIRTKSSAENKRSEDTTKPTPAPRRLPSFSKFKTRLTDSNNTPVPIPPNNARKTDTDDKDTTGDEVSTDTLPTTRKHFREHFSELKYPSSRYIIYM